MKTTIEMPGVDFVGIIAEAGASPTAMFDIPHPESGALTRVTVPLYANESIEVLGPHINSIGNVVLTLHIEIGEED